MPTIEDKRERLAEKFAKRFMEEHKNLWLDPTEVEPTVRLWVKRIGAKEQVPMIDLLVNMVSAVMD